MNSFHPKDYCTAKTAEKNRSRTAMEKKNRASAFYYQANPDPLFYMYKILANAIAHL